MENKPFDPQDRDSDFYSSDPYQHGTSDYGRESEGVGNQQYNSISGMDQDTESTAMTRGSEKNREGAEREPGPDNHGTTQEWDVDPEVIAKSRRDAAREPDSVESGLPSSLEGLPDNPSDEALFVRKDATYLEEGDSPKEGYDPHNLGYDSPEKKS